MKRLLTVTILLFASLLYSQSKFDINNLIDRGVLKYAPNDDEPYTGKVFDFYDNGQKKLDGNYRKGLMNGKWMYYHENGQIYVQGRFIDGDGSNLSELSGVPFNGRTGRWNAWFKNGQKESEGTYKSGIQIGKYEKWFENGKKKYEETYKDGELNGKWTEWFENGQKKSEETYKDGQLDGKVKGYYENGQKRLEGYFKDNKQDGFWTSWYENGKKEEEGTYKDGKLNGKWAEWHENGQKWYEGTFKDGEEIGSTDWEYYSNGQKRVERNYKDGKEDGKWTHWYDNGQKWKEVTYKNGIPNGLWTQWYENGQKKSEETYKDGERDGKWTYWHENGQKEEEGTLKDGKIDGIWTSWDRDGNVEKIIDIAAEIAKAAEEARLAEGSTYLSQKLELEQDLHSRIENALSKILDDQLFVWDVTVDIKFTPTQKSFQSEPDIERMEISCILPEGLAPELIENVRQIILVESRFDRSRGDILSLMTALFKQRIDEKCWDENGNECESCENWWEGCK